MSKQFIIFGITFSLAFILLYQLGNSLPAIVLPTTEQQEESSSRTQEESENERQLEEQTLLAQMYAPVFVCDSISSYFLGNTLIPDTFPIPLHEPPPNSCS